MKCIKLKDICTNKCTTSCRLISLVENVLFWWTSRVSDHSVLFLRFVGVGPTALLLALRDIPGDLPSLRSVLHYKRKTKIQFQLINVSSTTNLLSFTWGWYLPGWFGQSAGQLHSWKEISNSRGMKLWPAAAHACCLVPENQDSRRSFKLNSLGEQRSHCFLQHTRHYFKRWRKKREWAVCNDNLSHTQGLKGRFMAAAWAFCSSIKRRTCPGSHL